MNEIARRPKIAGSFYRIVEKHDIKAAISCVAPVDGKPDTLEDYDKEVYNGDVGYVTGVEPEGGELTAIFDERSVTYGFGELDTLVPAYAGTIHKSQGSEYPAVVIPVVTSITPCSNAICSTVTRGKRLVVLVGQRRPRHCRPWCIGAQAMVEAS